MGDDPSIHEFSDWIDDANINYSVVCTTVYYIYLRGLDEDVDTFVNRIGWERIPDGVEGTIDYLHGG